MAFQTVNGISVPSATAAEMREINRLAVEEFGLGILQVRENTERNLALRTLDVMGSQGTD